MPTGVIVRKKFADLDFTPVYASIEVEGANSKWVVEIPVEQGKAMENDGFDIGWVYHAEPYELARKHVEALREIFK
jgi:hypothetical protein